VTYAALEADVLQLDLQAASLSGGLQQEALGAKWEELVYKLRWLRETLVSLHEVSPFAIQVGAM
jgi:hypothetical protein